MLVYILFAKSTVTMAICRVTDIVNQRTALFPDRFNDIPYISFVVFSGFTPVSSIWVRRILKAVRANFSLVFWF